MRINESLKWKQLVDKVSIGFGTPITIPSVANYEDIMLVYQVGAGGNWNQAMSRAYKKSDLKSMAMSDYTGNGAYYCYTMSSLQSDTSLMTAGSIANWTTLRVSVYAR